MCVSAALLPVCVWEDCRRGARPSCLPICDGEGACNIEVASRPDGSMCTEATLHGQQQRSRYAACNTSSCELYPPCSSRLRAACSAISCAHALLPDPFARSQTSTPRLRTEDGNSLALRRVPTPPRSVSRGTEGHGEKVSSGGGHRHSSPMQMWQHIPWPEMAGNKLLAWTPLKPTPHTPFLPNQTGSDPCTRGMSNTPAPDHRSVGRFDPRPLDTRSIYARSNPHLL